MKKLKQLLILFTLLVTLFIPVSQIKAADNEGAVTNSSQTTDDSLQKVKDKGTLVVGLSADYPPYEFTAKVDGKTKYVGIDIDLAKQFAKDMGVKLVIKNMNFDSLLVALETHKVDAVISGMNPTAERQKSVDFSNIYYTGGKYIVINKKDKTKYTTKDSFSGQTVGAQNGTLEYSLIQKQMDGAKVKGLAKLNNLILALQSGKVAGVLMEEATAKAYVQNNSNLYAFNSKVKINTNETGTAIAFPKGSASLVAAANKTIAGVKKADLIDQQYVPNAAQYMQTASKQNTMLNYWTYFAKGLEYTLLITVVAVFFGFILGVLLALMRLSNGKILHSLAVAYIEFIRGTPLMVQVMFVYFGVGAIIQSLPALVAGIIAVSLNSAAYVAEVIRSGIESIAIGQTEAARSLGLSQKQTYQYVVIPQAIKNIWPALGNEFITLIKESSIVSVIGVGDLMYQTQLVQSATYKGVMPLFITMLIYFVVTFTLSKVLNYFEGKMKHA